MPQIHLLTKAVAELIAAGEVIERPASIVKELLENSIDAGATAVTVEIRQGGLGSIRVSDNGSGIAKDELPTAFLRHATSKIELADDLNSISTLGFRGEALASVAAVSRLELTAKTKESPLGATISLEGGVQTGLEDAGCPNGTTIVVRDLFYNVPARLKFMRKDAAEANAVASIAEKLALSHPEISFKLISDQKVKLHTPGDGLLLSAVRAVFGGDFADGMLPVDYGAGGVSVRGVVSLPGQARLTRAMQHFFVNGRYVRSPICSAALEDGCKNTIMVGKHPYCVLNISVPCDGVDVNVHPAKTEVRFVNDKAVFDAVYFSIKSSLSRDDILKKAANEMPPAALSSGKNLLSGFRNEEGKQEKLQNSLDAEHVNGNGFTPSVSPILTLHDRQAPLIMSEESAESIDPEESYRYISSDSLRGVKHPAARADAPPVTVIWEEDSPPEPSAASPAEPDADLPEFSVRMIGELFRTYVLFEAGDSFFLLDKHAAHERILFEKLKLSVDLKERQLLLQPVVVHVSREEHQAALEQSEQMAAMGFSFEDFGGHTLLVREVPLALADCDVAAVFMDIAQKLLENRRELSSGGYDGLLHSIACRAAVKAHDTSGREELLDLLRRVYENDEIRHCPHGRPVAIELTRAELEKRFGRA